jgi:hypothetical protein
LKPTNLLTPIIGLVSIVLFYVTRIFLFLLIALGAFTVGFYLMGRSSRSKTKKDEENSSDESGGANKKGKSSSTKTQ